MEIITNNVPRDIIHGFELSEKERGEFDCYSTDDLDNATFFRYRGQLIDLGEFMRWDNPASPTSQNWDGFRPDSYFSGLVVRYTDAFERVVVGLALS